MNMLGVPKYTVNTRTPQQSYAGVARPPDNSVRLNVLLDSPAQVGTLLPAAPRGWATHPPQHLGAARPPPSRSPAGRPARGLPPGTRSSAMAPRWRGVRSMESPALSLRLIWLRRHRFGSPPRSIWPISAFRAVDLAPLRPPVLLSLAPASHRKTTMHAEEGRDGWARDSMILRGDRARYNSRAGGEE
jgi:hypothetical protein